MTVPPPIPPSSNMWMTLMWLKRQDNLEWQLVLQRILKIDFLKNRPYSIIQEEKLCEKVFPLGTYIDQDLSWTTETPTTVKKAQQRLDFLRILKEKKPAGQPLVSNHCCSVWTVLTHCVSVWNVSCSAAVESVSEEDRWPLAAYWQLSQISLPQQSSHSEKVIPPSLNITAP